MLDTNNHSIHYKMYKSGKSWVFAGLISAGLLLSFGGETAFADTPADSDSAAPQTEQVSPEKTVEQPSSQDNPTTLPKADSDSAPVQSSEDNIPTEPKDSQPDNDPAPSDAPDKNVTLQDNEETNPSNLHKNNYSTSGVTTDSLNKTPGDSEASSIKQTAPKRPQPRLVMAPGAPIPAPAAAPIAVTAPIAEDDESIDVWMPNKTLQQMVSKSLKTSISSITKDSMSKLTSLAVSHGSLNTYVNGLDSFDLTGLEYAVNLSSLDLSYDPMMDYLMSTSGGLMGDITDLSPLQSLTKLTSLNLSYNRIKSVAPLADLTQLTSLQIDHNAVSDFSPLNATQFTTLNMKSQSLILTDDVRIIDPANPAITIPLDQIVKLPQNYTATFSKTMESDDSYTSLLTLVNQDHMSGKGQFHLYKSGTEHKYYSFNADNSVTFTNISEQVSPYTLWYADWPIYQYPNATPIQNPYEFYLRADLSTNTGLSFNIFIPYDNPKQAADLTVHYVDMASNKPIQPDKIITDKLTSDTYDLTAEQTSVKGYTFDHADGALTGNFTADPLTVTLYFTKDPTKPVTPVTPPVVTPTTQTTVTAHYVDQNGKTVHADQVLTGHAGDSYSTTAFTIPGYDLTTTPENASGTFGDTDTTVTYVYRDQTSGNGVEVNIDPTYPVKPATPVQPATPVKQEPTTGDQAAIIHHPGNTNQKGGAAVRVPATTLTTQNLATPVKSVAASSASKTTLPQTSEHRVTPLLGIALLLGTFLGFGLKRKQH